MNELKYAVICVDDDPYILQMLGFQLDKFIEKRTTVIEFFTDPLEAIKNIKQLVAEKIEILFCGCRLSNAPHDRRRACSVVKRLVS